jgi:hypothetical protein
MSHYNPYTATISAAFTELTSDRAQQYYALRAQQDTQMVLDAALSAGIAAYEAAVFTYNLGAFVRAWMHSIEQNAQYAPVECVVDPEPQIGDDEFWAAVDSAVEALEFVENTFEAELVTEPVVYLLPPAAPIQLFNNDRSILNAIVEPLVIAATQAEAAKYLKSVAPKAKSKTATKKRTPKASAKTATPAPRKSPTRATVGAYSACID